MSRTVQQNLITQSTDGTVSASFPGGLDMLTGTPGDPSTPTSPVPDKSVRWHRSTVDGPTAAYIAVGDDPTQTTMNIVTNSARDRLLSSVFMQANDPSPVNDSWLGVSVGGGQSYTVAYAAGQQKVIIDKAGKSGFIQSGFNSNRTYIFALEVRFDGILTLINDPLGSGFLLTSRTAVGQYQLTFPACTLPIPSFNPQSPANGIQIQFRNSTTVVVGTMQNGAMVDANFSGLLTLCY